MKVHRFIFCLFTLYSHFLSYSQTPDSIGVYSFVPVAPVFKNGEQALFQLIHDSIQYPADALREHKSGKVQLKFIINENGDVSEVKAIRGICPSLDAEAIRVVSLTSGKWESGKISDKAIKTYKYLPITFTIDTTADEAESQKMEFIGGDSAFFSFIKKNVQIPRIVAEANLWTDAKILVTFDSTNHITRATSISINGQKDLINEGIRLVNLTEGKWSRTSPKKNYGPLTKLVTVNFTKDLIAPQGKNLIIIPNEDIVEIANNYDPAFRSAFDAYIAMDYPTALSLFEKCLEKNPDYRAARMEHAICLALMGRLDNACDEFNKLSHENIGGMRIQKFYQLICLEKYETKDPSHVRVLINRYF